MAFYVDPDGNRVDTVRPSRRRMRSDDLGRAPPAYMTRGGLLIPEFGTGGVDMLRSHSTGHRQPYVRPVVVSHFSERGRPLSHHDEDDRWDSREPSPYSFVSSRSYYRGSRANSRHRSSWGSRDPSPGYGQLVPYDDPEDEEKEAMKRQLMLYKQEMKRKADEKRVKEEVAIRLAKEEKERKEREEQKKEIEKEAIHKFKKKQLEEEEKKKTEKADREREYRERVRRDFGDKLPESEIERIIATEEAKRNAAFMSNSTMMGPMFQNPLPLFGAIPPDVPAPMIAPAGMPVSGSGQAIDMSKPVFTKMSRRHLSLKTLEAFRVDFYVDHVRIALSLASFSVELTVCMQVDTSYVIIRRFVPPQERQIWWDHTAMIRAQKRFQPVGIEIVTDADEQRAKELAAKKKERRKSTSQKGLFRW